MGKAAVYDAAMPFGCGSYPDCCTSDSVKHHHSTIGMANIKDAENTKCSQGHGTTRTHTLLMGVYNGAGILENSLAAS